MTNRFVALDVETANEWFGSICQIGAVIYEDGLVVEKWSTLVDPETYFSDMNVSIHGITPSQVASAPVFADAYRDFCTFVGSLLLSSYGHFDKSAFSQACARYDLPLFDNEWINLQRVVRRAWPEKFAVKGYGLAKVSKFLGVALENHHDALADAVAAADIFWIACQYTETEPHGWPAILNKRPVTSTQENSVLEINCEGPLVGEYIAFTGALSIARNQAAVLAASMGCVPQRGVNKLTSILVVGNQDLSRIRGDLSGKHRKALMLIDKGQEIRIMGESDFLSFVQIS